MQGSRAGGTDLNELTTRRLGGLPGDYQLDVIERAANTIDMLRVDLADAAAMMRAHAARTGPMHAWWDHIALFESHLNGNLSLADIQLMTDRNARIALENIQNNPLDLEKLRVALGIYKQQSHGTPEAERLDQIEIALLLFMGLLQGEPENATDEAKAAMQAELAALVKAIRNRHAA